jgi:hypothetical protein
MFPGDSADRRGDYDKVRLGARLAESRCAPNASNAETGTQQSIAKASKAERLEEITSRKGPHSNPILSPVMVLYPATPLATFGRDPLRKFGIGEFREKLASYLLEAEQPLAITGHGDTVGYQIPTEREPS